MTPTEMIRRYVLEDLGMDAVGIASPEALDDERAGHRPEDILPGARSVIVFLKHIPDGILQAAFQAKEDGNADAFSIYAAFGRAFRATEHWKLFLLSSHTEFERCFGRTADKKRKLYNGMIKCDLFMYL